MKPSLRTSFVVVIALTVTQVCMLAQHPADGSAQAASHGNGRALEGVWDASVTLLQCDTGNPLGTGRSMSMFIRGGTQTETGNTFFRGPGLGTWRHIGGQSYSAVRNLFRFNTDGTFAGRTRISQNIELDENADEYSTTAVAEVFNAAEELVFSFCATGTATRLE